MWVRVCCWMALSGKCFFLRTKAYELKQKFLYFHILNRAGTTHQCNQLRWLRKLVVLHRMHWFITLFMVIPYAGRLWLSGMLKISRYYKNIEPGLKWGNFLKRDLINWCSARSVKLRWPTIPQQHNWKERKHPGALQAQNDDIRLIDWLNCWKNNW